ncbi:hypothetical protein [Helicobacter rodentium]|uniref:hypothetical protein n=1 Tax=Helicobacter rodentium TaxID=59617 RepID=UPI003F4CDAEB
MLWQSLNFNIGLERTLLYMTINQNLNSLGGIYNNETNRLLSENAQSAQSISKIQNKETQEKDKDGFNIERITYGMISLELMNDDQYLAFERVTAGMSPNEKISVAQMLTRAGNLSASVERVEQREKESLNTEKEKKELGLFGITQKGWQEVAQEFQDNLNHLDGLYTKRYDRNLTSNYNDILRKNTEAKTQRILREFSHAIYSGNVQIDTIS